LKRRSGSVNSDYGQIFAACEKSDLPQRFNNAQRHIVIIAEHHINLIAVTRPEGVHLFYGPGTIPHSCIGCELSYLDTCRLYRFYGIFGAQFRVLMAGFAFQHDITEFFIFALVGYPPLSCNLALHGAGFFSLCADIEHFVPRFHVIGKRFPVKKHHRYIRRFRLADDGSRRSPIHRIDGYGFHFFGNELIHLIILGGLGVLGIHHVDYRFAFGVIRNGVPHIRHKGVIKFVDGYPNRRQSAAV